MCAAARCEAAWRHCCRRCCRAAGRRGSKEGAARSCATSTRTRACGCCRCGGFGAAARGLKVWGSLGRPHLASQGGGRWAAALGLKVRGPLGRPRLASKVGEALGLPHLASKGGGLGGGRAWPRRLVRLWGGRTWPQRVGAWGACAFSQSACMPLLVPSLVNQSRSNPLEIVASHPAAILFVLPHPAELHACSSHLLLITPFSPIMSTPSRPIMSTHSVQSCPHHPVPSCPNDPVPSCPHHPVPSCPHIPSHHVCAVLLRTSACPITSRSGPPYAHVTAADEPSPIRASQSILLASLNGVVCLERGKMRGRIRGRLWGPIP
eukprot:214894-Chlamydomonas_euryale.AAC.1